MATATAILNLLVLGLLIGLLERNHRRNTGPQSPQGSTDVHDSDLSRVHADLAALAEERPAPPRPEGRLARALAHLAFAAQRPTRVRRPARVPRPTPVRH
ncbi:hypothetical protein JOF53_005883 [Crossiella equi]|uniref:Uncharacterized protein n=1 Tax=Crossiella equi TaxID=130796 RepID=A0ABS5AKA9_9PSEU|nr:hypothetical protein [Crossiella equi]MBP2477011.1 hypothetical protein [Crossiella equi]